MIDQTFESLAQVVSIGTPYHGLYRESGGSGVGEVVFADSSTRPYANINGSHGSTGWAFSDRAGTAFLVKVPGLPAPPTPTADDVANHRVWLDYAFQSGVLSAIGGKSCAASASNNMLSIYIDGNKNRWLIEVKTNTSTFEVRSRRFGHLDNSSHAWSSWLSVSATWWYGRPDLMARNSTGSNLIFGDLYSEVDYGIGIASPAPSNQKWPHSFAQIAISGNGDEGVANNGLSYSFSILYGPATTEEITTVYSDQYEFNVTNTITSNLDGSGNGTQTTSRSASRVDAAGWISKIGLGPRSSNSTRVRVRRLAPIYDASDTLHWLFVKHTKITNGGAGDVWTFTDKIQSVVAYTITGTIDPGSSSQHHTESSYEESTVEFFMDASLIYSKTLVGVDTSIDETYGYTGHISGSSFYYYGTVSGHTDHSGPTASGMGVTDTASCPNPSDLSGVYFVSPVRLSFQLYGVAEIDFRADKSATGAIVKLIAPGYSSSPSYSITQVSRTYAGGTVSSIIGDNPSDSGRFGSWNCVSGTVAIDSVPVCYV